LHGLPSFQSEQMSPTDPNNLSTIDALPASININRINRFIHLSIFQNPKSENKSENNRCKKPLKPPLKTGFYLGVLESLSRSE
jgi:hypothetical protein